MNSPAGPDATRIAYFILKKVKRAVREFNMIRPGDRIAVAVSGGKDSLGLLYLLQQCRLRLPFPFELAAIHVRGDARGITTPHPPLERWLEVQGVPYKVVEPEIGPEEALPLGCQRCTWLRRKAIFLAAEELGCNVVAFAHHADDAAQTTLLNVLYTGSVRTLEPCADYFQGHFRVVRPLFYVPESELARLARAAGFPPPPPLCPRAGESARQRMAQMLRQLGRDYPDQVRPNLIRVGLAGCREGRG
jgi:tRNA 2-thiocytidine biosynthesis protein TtcA